MLACLVIATKASADAAAPDQVMFDDLEIKTSLTGTPGDVAFGEYLSSQCVTCHQLSGASNGIPPIVGWDTTSFYQVMDTYRQKARDNEAMQTIAASLSDQDIKALAAYFATIEPKED